MLTIKLNHLRVEVFGAKILIAFLILVCVDLKVSKASVDSSLAHLSSVMDAYHKSFDVYTDQDAGGNHFIPSGWMGD